MYLSTIFIIIVEDICITKLVLIMILIKEIYLGLPSLIYATKYSLEVFESISNSEREKFVVHLSQGG